MPRNTVSLKPGSRVLFDDQPWIIEAQEDLGRVLVRAVGDGRREFLDVAQLKRAPAREPADPAAPPHARAENGTTKKGCVSRLAAQLRRRQVRVIPQETERTRHDDAVIEQVTQEFQIICGVLDAPSEAERLHRLAELRARYGYSAATAYRRIRCVRLAGVAEALLRSVRSDKGQLRLNQAQLRTARERLDKHRFIEESQSIPHIVDLVNGDLRRQGEAEISRRALYLLEKRVKTPQQILLSQGKKDKARDLYGSRAGELPHVLAPLSIVQIDHTTCQIIFVDEQTREPIGDAWLTLVIDCFSRMVLGYYLSFDAPSATSAGIALARSFLPKDQHLASVKVVGSWPCWGYPAVIVADNAAELNGYLMQAAARREAFNIRNRPVDFPKFGGHIESSFRTFMGMRKAVKGTKFANPTERGQYDSKAKATLTLTEFDQIFTEYLVNDYHLAEHSGRGMDKRAPLQRWKAGIFGGDKRPGIGLPDIPDDAEQVYISMLPVDHRSVKNMVVKIFTETYFSHALSKLSDEVDAEAPASQRLHEIRYDPRNIATIWVRHPATGAYLAARVQNVEWTYMSLWEHKALRKRLGRPADEYKEARYQSKLRRIELQEQAENKTKRAKAQRKRSAQDKRNLGESVVKPAPPPVNKAKVKAPVARKRSKPSGEYKPRPPVLAKMDDLL